ncbi:Cysteine desulfurase protein [Salinisphaera shabanensis E1L3A]|uniref:Cysteine desulfurase protein n=1 Tax=Salinisphaera shabanensis E1L3A TaxID=1033802 RepID=U2FXZ4_9GAMM|nr:cysteine desulfurase family protein [Salinisphaera shabanensis]ERJ20704.1 Cysteine desulfurase protein [Salinisphaera shabanensis E1L3A]
MNAASETIYLDYAATAPLAPGVMEVMQHALMATDANPASLHGPGREAARLIDTAAAEVAQLINAREKDLIWTSGATESINLALKGVVAFAGTDAHIVSVVTEHSATLDTLAWLEKYGTRVTRLPVDSDGRIDLGDLESALADNATLVSIMHVNNETGVIQDIAAIGERCAAHGVDLHVDAAQSLGRLALDVERMQIALLSLSAHKIGGPKGVGALYVRPRTGLAAQLHGGGQQRGLRSGTLATHQIAGFGAAAAHMAAIRDSEQKRLAVLRDHLSDALARADRVMRNGGPVHTAAPFLNVSVAGVHGDALLKGLTDGAPALAVSSGAACSAAKGQSSYVLRAMGRSPREAGASIRFSLGAGTTAAQIDAAADRFVSEVSRLRAIADAA